MQTGSKVLQQHSAPLFTKANLLMQHFSWARVTEERSALYLLADDKSVLGSKAAQGEAQK